MITLDYLRSWAVKFAPFFLALARRICFTFGASTIALRLTMLEHRLTSSNALTKEICNRLPESMSRIETLMRPPRGNRDIAQRRSIVLQAPEVTTNAVKKGVLLITFTESFRYFHRHIDIERLMRYFRVVLEPSTSGYCLPEILLWAKYNQPVIVQASEARDRKFLKELGTSLVPISIGASDWVDHRIFRPLGSPKIYDVVYVAHLAPVKRVHAYLRALKTLVSRGKSVNPALVLSSWGGKKSTLDQLLEVYGLRDRIALFMDLSQPTLNEILNRSKVSVLLSKKEGSSRVLFESMFADVPVILLKENIGVNKDYINQYTGLLVSETELPDAIIRVGSMFPQISPRSWAMDNIAPEITTRKLQTFLDSQYSHEEASTSPLWVKVNSEEATYMDPAVFGRVPDITVLLDCFARDAPANEVDGGLDARIRDLFRRARE